MFAWWSATASAQTLPPSYVGDWYEYSYDYGRLKDSTEDGLIAQVEALINSSPYQMSLSVCGQYKWLKNSGDWKDLDSSTVAGTATLSRRYYGSRSYYRTQQDDLSYKCFTSEGTNSHSLERRRLVCPPQTIFAHGDCVALRESPPLEDVNNGPSCPLCQLGQPINPSTGNMWHVEQDYATVTGVGRLAVERTYNSMPLMPVVRGGVLGQGWTTGFDVRLEQTPLLPEYARIKCWIRSDNNERLCPLLPAPALAIPTALAIYRADGKSHTFQKNGDAWYSRADVNDRLTAIFDATKSAVLGWNFITGDGSTSEQFDFNGLRTQVNYAKGGAHRFTYATAAGNDTTVSRYPADAPICRTSSVSPIIGVNRLLCVTDHWGRQLNFKYDQAGRIAEMIDPQGQSTFYEYDGESAGCTAAAPQSAACSGNVLTKVTYPGGKSRTYIYNEAAQVNAGKVCPNGTAAGTGRAHLTRALTGLIDEAGLRSITWTYNCDGRATSSQLAGGMERVSLTYDASESSMATAVTHDLGDPANPQTTTRTFSATKKLGTFKNSSISGPCVECGSISYRNYDAKGNMLQANNFNGYATFYEYNTSRNLEVQRTVAWGVSESLIFNTAWHPIFRLPVKISEPKKLLTFTYDERGNLLTRTEQASTDPYGGAGFAAVLIGTPRIWTTTYNAAGQVQTVRGPRTDVLDLTSYEYDSMGNLSVVTNAAGHKTTLSDYDAHGHVGRIDAPNGARTTFSYTPRGWLDSTVLDDGSTLEQTSYVYSDVGKLTRATMPSGAWVAYSYDSAYRLTGISDHLGNSITYTLDLTGNRVREQVADSGGNLRRQVTRVFDTMNRVRQQTGGVQ